MGWSTRWEETVVSNDFVGGEGPMPEAELLKGLEPDLTPNTILTFECVECKIEFDCNTNSFMVLCTKAKEAGWKMKWLDNGYETTCRECLK